MLLPDERVALLTNARLLCLHAPGFARVHALAEEGVALGSEDDIPAAQIKWSVEWRVRRRFGASTCAHCLRMHTLARCLHRGVTSGCSAELACLAHCWRLVQDRPAVHAAPHATLSSNRHSSIVHCLMKPPAAPVGFKLYKFMT